METIAVYSAIPANDRCHRTSSEANVTQQRYNVVAKLFLPQITTSITYWIIENVIAQ